MCCIDNDFDDGHKVFIKKTMLYQYQRNQRVLQMFSSVFISKKLTRLLTLIVFFSLVNILVYFGNKLLNFSLLFFFCLHTSFSSRIAAVNIPVLFAKSS